MGLSDFRFSFAKSQRGHFFNQIYVHNLWKTKLISINTSKLPKSWGVIYTYIIHIWPIKYSLIYPMTFTWISCKWNRRLPDVLYITSDRVPFLDQKGMPLSSWVDKTEKRNTSPNISFQWSSLDQLNLNQISFPETTSKSGR